MHADYSETLASFYTTEDMLDDVYEQTNPFNPQE
jgi:hypothetical protein